MSKEKKIPDHMVVCVDGNGMEHLIPKTVVDGPFFKEMNMYIKPESGSSLAQEFREFEEKGKNNSKEADEFQAVLLTVTDKKVISQLKKKHKDDVVKLAAIEQREKQLTEQENEVK